MRDDALLLLLLIMLFGYWYIQEARSDASQSVIFPTQTYSPSGSLRSVHPNPTYVDLINVVRAQVHLERSAFAFRRSQSQTRLSSLCVCICVRNSVRA